VCCYSAGCYDPNAGKTCCMTDMGGYICQPGVDCYCLGDGDVTQYGGKANR
jgi:hypothetical protein